MINSNIALRLKLVKAYCRLYP